MNRRIAIRNILIASAGTIMLPSCSKLKVPGFLTDGKLSLDTEHKDYLQNISESFLPIRSISNKIGPAQDFILTILNDNFAPENIQMFATGFEQYKDLMDKSKLMLNSSNLEKAIPIVENILNDDAPNEELVFFINTTKDLSIRNLMTSEYYMTEYLDYTLVPGPSFDGCIDI